MAHGWWIDGEFVPCSCDRCATDREEAEELAEAEAEAYAYNAR